MTTIIHAGVKVSVPDRFMRHYKALQRQAVVLASHPCDVMMYARLKRDDIALYYDSTENTVEVLTAAWPPGGRPRRLPRLA